MCLSQETDPGGLMGEGPNVPLGFVRFCELQHPASTSAPTQGRGTRPRYDEPTCPARTAHQSSPPSTSASTSGPRRSPAAAPRSAVPPPNGACLNTSPAAAACSSPPQQLLHEVWRPTAHQTHYLRVYLAHLRRKLEPDPTHPRYLITDGRPRLPIRNHKRAERIETGPRTTSADPARPGADTDPPWPGSTCRRRPTIRTRPAHAPSAPGAGTRPATGRAGPSRSRKA